MNGTSCKDCSWSLYDGEATHNTEGKTQTGCALGRLEVLSNNGVKVIEAYDEEKEFFVLDKICYYHRNSQWILPNTMVYGNDGNLYSQTIDAYRLDIEKENSLKYHAVLWENSEMDIYKALHGLSIQSNKPKHITVLLRYESIHNIHTLKKELDRIGTSWDISEKVGIETDDIYHGVKAAMKNSTAPFVLIVFSDKDVYANLFENIEQDMINKGLSFNYVLCPKKSILVPYKILAYYIAIERGNFINQILEDECLTAYSV